MEYEVKFIGVDNAYKHVYPEEEVEAAVSHVRNLLAMKIAGTVKVTMRLEDGKRDAGLPEAGV